ncbi:unnamed protein product [Amoebophrya sp. A25]|nr:unnamed protein product [Amoebophrya sp. A25]|eukprot:GSA25T00015134001.1
MFDKIMSSSSLISSPSFTSFLSHENTKNLFKKIRALVLLASHGFATFSFAGVGNPSNDDVLFTRRTRGKKATPTAFRGNTGRGSAETIPTYEDVQDGSWGGPVTTTSTPYLRGRDTPMPVVQLEGLVLPGRATAQVSHDHATSRGNHKTDTGGLQLPPKQGVNSTTNRTGGDEGTTGRTCRTSTASSKQDVAVSKQYARDLGASLSSSLLTATDVVVPPQKLQEEQLQFMMRRAANLPRQGLENALALPAFPDTSSRSRSVAGVGGAVGPRPLFSKAAEKLGFLQHAASSEVKTTDIQEPIFVALSRASILEGCLQPISMLISRGVNLGRVILYVTRSCSAVDDVMEQVRLQKLSAGLSWTRPVWKRQQERFLSCYGPY